jgi:hypothetical protein
MGQKVKVKMTTLTIRWSNDCDGDKNCACSKVGHIDYTDMINEAFKPIIPYIYASQSYPDPCGEAWYESQIYQFLHLPVKELIQTMMDCTQFIVTWSLDEEVIELEIFD